MRPQQGETVLDTGGTAWNPPEVVAAEVLLPDHVERAVVGRDDLEGVLLEGPPEHLLVLARAQGRSDDVGGALEVGRVVRRLVEEQVLGTGLAMDRPAGPLSPLDGLDRLPAGDVDDVERRLVDAGQGGDSVRRLALQCRGPRPGVASRVLRRQGGVALSQMLDRLAVLGVDQDQGIEAGDSRHRGDEIVLGEPDGVLVGHVHFEARHASGDAGPELSRCAVAPPGDRHVETEVGGGDLRLAATLVERLDEALAALRMDEIDDRRGATGQARRGSALEVVGGDRPRDRQRHVDVGIDTAGNDRETGGVEDLVAVRFEGFAQLDDGAVAAADVATPTALVGDDVATAHQEASAHRTIVRPPGARPMPLESASGLGRDPCPTSGSPSTA